MSVRTLTLMLGFAAAAAVTAAQAPGPSGQPPANGVRCPAGFETIYDASAKVMRCRKDFVSWVVTGCTDKSFASYVVKDGRDACAPTEIPGVGTPPGARGTRSVACVAAGYELMTDRTGQRDRCERTERAFALPQPAGR